MKNIIKMLGIIALAALIVFSMAAYPDGSGGGGGGGGGDYGRPTVTGLPPGSWGVFIYPAGTDISSWSAWLNNHSSCEASGAPNLANNLAYTHNRPL